MRFSIFQDSAIGGRPVNQDRMGYCYTRSSLMMVLADGMGGHLRGEVAAQIAVQAAGAAFRRLARPRLTDPSEFLGEVLMNAHRDILRYQSLHRLPEAPRTTFVACVVQDGRAWWAHAGDSRCYWVRDARLRTCTRDHSRVADLVAMGVIRPEEALHHPERHLVSNCLGAPFVPRIEIAGGERLRGGDTLMLCSDGIWSAIPDDELCRRIGGAPAATAVPELVRDAVRRSGPSADNATVVAMNWESDDTSGERRPEAAFSDAEVTTTIALEPFDDAEIPELSEDEIERTIAEIRLAIARKGARSG